MEFKPKLGFYFSAKELEPSDIVELEQKSREIGTAEHRGNTVNYIYDKCALYGNQLTEAVKEIAEMRAALGQLGHMEEPEEFNHDQTYGFLFAYEEVIKRARQALQNTTKEG